MGGGGCVLLGEGGGRMGAHGVLTMSYGGRNLGCKGRGRGMWAGFGCCRVCGWVCMGR